MKNLIIIVGSIWGALALTVGIAYATGNVHGIGGGGDVTATDVEYGLVNPSTLKVRWTAKGDAGADGTCYVRATDPSGEYEGSDTAMFTLGSDSELWWINLPISNEGAAYVTDVTVNC